MTLTRIVTVVGVPAPQGSKKYVGHRAGKPVLLESSAKVRPWRAAVAQAAALHPPLPEGAVTVEVVFRLPRPKSLPKRVTTHTRKPDLDKLVRSTLDALSGVLYADDNRVDTLTARKTYATPEEQPGATICVTVNNQEPR